MNLSECTNNLFDYFLENDVLKLSDYNKHFLLVEDVELNKEVVRLACQELVKSEVLKEFSVEGETFFVLTKNLESYSQTIELSGQSCQFITSIINSYCDELNAKENSCNVLNITDKDIQNLLKIIVGLEDKLTQGPNDE
jgi:hypothetical protein